MLHQNHTKPFVLPQLIRNRCCIETKLNHFHCHSWSGTDTALRPNQTIFIATAGHCHSCSGTDIALKPNQTMCIATAGQDIALKLNQSICIAPAGQEQILH